MNFSKAIEILEKLNGIPSNILDKFVNEIIYAKKRGKRIWIAGNGGSACTASHLASDLMNLGFDVVSLVDNPARISAITNDYGWEFVYTKQMENFKEGDIYLPISVHGGGKMGDEWSSNLLLAEPWVRGRGGKTLSLIGCDGGRLKDHSDVYIIIPDNSCCYVEGFHSLVCHMLIEEIKRKMKK